MPPADVATEQMECMEVWGGSEPIARRVQMRGLDAWVYSRPFHEARGGGDVYYASSCATGRISRLLLADVAGHGSAVADVAVRLRGLMRRFVNFIDQGEFVRAMNRTFVACSPDGCFATALVSTFFAPTNRLTVCNAGHPQPLWYRARERRWSLLRQVAEVPGQAVPNNMPLGILDMVDYQQSDLEMGVGDLMVFYTDALIEGHDAAGEMLGEAGLLRVVRDLGTIDPATFIDALLAAVAALNARNLDDDDVTVLLLRPTGSGTAAPLLARVRGAARLAGAIMARLGSGSGPAPLPDLKLANVGGAVLPWLSRFWRAKPTEE
jgi:sigma-B regulation protein RsbU (phosphoserine phosphatase)